MTTFATNMSFATNQLLAFRPLSLCTFYRGEVFEDALGLEGVLKDTISSPWPRRSSPCPQTLQVLKNAPSSARGQHYFLTG